MLSQNIINFMITQCVPLFMHRHCIPIMHLNIKYKIGHVYQIYHVHKLIMFEWFKHFNKVKLFNYLRSPGFLVCQILLQAFAFLRIAFQPFINSWAQFGKPCPTYMPALRKLISWVLWINLHRYLLMNSLDQCHYIIRYYFKGFPCVSQHIYSVLM